MHLEDLIHWERDLPYVTRLLAALVLGAFIGYERQRHGHVAGIRTYGTVALGACLFGLVSLRITEATADPTRIAAQVVSGIGFLGAGIILQDQRGRTRGITTAANIWATAAVGLATAFDMLLIAASAAVLLVVFLGAQYSRRWQRYKRERVRRRRERDREEQRPVKTLPPPA